MGCLSPSCVAWWLLGIVVNALFCGGIAIGLTSDGLWPLSLALSFVYTIVLFFVTRYLDRAQQSTLDGEIPDDMKDPSVEEDSPDQAGSSAVNNESNVAPSEGAREHNQTKVPVYLSLLYGLFTLAIGTPGAIIATKAIPCPSRFRGYNSNNDKPTWKTDESLLPDAVRTWNKENDPGDPDQGPCYRGRNCDQPDPSSMFAQINDNGTTTVYFAGSEAGSGAKLYATMSNEAPKQVESFKNPAWLTTVSNEYICFLTTENGNQESWYGVDEDLPVLHCGNEASGFEAAPRFKRGVRPINFVAIDGLLWFQQSYPWSGGGDYEQANGYAVVSVDPADMDDLTIHSVLEESSKSSGGSGEGGGCTDGPEILLSNGALAVVLFLSALPMALMSGWLWSKKAIPSSSIFLFLSIGLVLGSIVSFGNPYAFQGFFMAWVVFASPFWLVTCSYVLTVSKRVSKGPLKWSVYGLSLVIFGCSMYAMFEIDYEALEYGNSNVGETLPTAIIFFIFVFAPLCCIGIIVGSWVIMLLGAMGATVDITAATYVMLKESGAAAVVVGVECVVLLASIILLCMKRDSLQKRMVDFLRKCTGYLCGSANPYTEEEEAATESLLLRESNDGGSEDDITGEMA